MSLKRNLTNGVLVGWFVASLLGQHPDDSYGKIRRLDRLTGGFFIPNWKFFAPNPGINDYVLLYRLESDQGDFTEWRRLIPVSKPGLVASFYSRESRFSKGILDITTMMQICSANPALKEQVECSRELLLGCIRERVGHVPGYVRFQAMLARGAGYDTEAPPIYEFIFEPTPTKSRAEFDLHENRPARGFVSTRRATESSS